MSLAGCPKKSLAERVGFEPTVRFKTDNALAGRPIRPLWHLSWERLSVSGGTEGIRTPGAFGPPAFKAGAFVRSATVPLTTLSAGSRKEKT